LLMLYWKRGCICDILQWISGHGVLCLGSQTLCETRLRVRKISVTTSLHSNHLTWCDEVL
jgi:hypothetical protein